MRAADFHERPAEKCPRAWDIHERPAFFHERPAFFHEKAAEKCPRAWDIHERPAEKNDHARNQGLDTILPPPSTRNHSPLTLHHSPFTTHQNPVQVVQHISIAQFRLFSLVFFCFLLFLKARFSGPMASGCLSQSGMRKFTTSCSTVMVKGPSSWRSRRPSTPTSAWRASSTSMWRVR